LCPDLLATEQAGSTLSVFALQRGFAGYTAPAGCRLAMPVVPAPGLGMPDLAGHTASSVEIHSLERLLKQAILDYEPRLIRKTVRVKLKLAESRMNHNAMTFDIEADLWADPVPLHMYMKTEIDLEIGDVNVSEYSGRSSR